jgi:DNA-damage-inducible protein D
MSEKNKNKSIAIFDDEPVRRVWSDKEEKWFFSVVDIVKILINQTDFQTARKYWNKLKERLKKEGSESVTNCHQLKLLANDGKMRETDVSNAETLFRIIQSIPSPKAEPFKVWLAKVGYERLKENVDPEIALNRARENWIALGRSTKWIEQRMRGQEIRNKLTDYWSDHKITEEDEFARLTNIIHKEWSGVSIKKHKKIKNLKGHNLRDHMSEAELIFTSLAELSTRRVAEKDKADGYKENSVAAVKGGRYAGKAKKDFEKLTGRKVVTGNNFLPPQNEIKKLKK